MKGLLFLCFSLFVLACGKDKEDHPTQSDNFLHVQNHSWVMDSLYSYVLGDTIKSYATDAPDAILLYTFTADKYIFSDYFGKDTSLLAYQNPDRIYFWSPDAQKNDSTYFTVVSVDNYNIVLKQKRPYDDILFIYAHAR
jgi:hypothetical protein